MTYYKIKGKTTLHKDKNCHYLAKTDKENIVTTKSSSGDKCNHCGK